MFKHQKNKELGITLIALVVTIIVLLILAGISIMMLTGDNGILQRATQAKEETVAGQEKEQVELAYISAAMKKLGDDVTANDLQDELDAMLGDTGETDETKKKTNIKQNSNNTLNVLFTETQHNYNVNKGKVTKALEDGIYVGNVRMGKIKPFSFSYETYDAYKSSISQEEENISSFFYKCYSKTATNSDYKNAIDDAETAGINKEWIDYAYNNQGDRIRNIQASLYNIELLSQDRKNYNIYIPLTARITSENENFEFDLNFEILYQVELYRIDSYGVDYTNVTMNPEPISFRYNDSNQAIPDEVQLPFGMVLKQDKNSNLVIEWQGQTFNENQLRTYINNNTKIVYNGQTLNLTSSTSGEQLDDLFGIRAWDLYDNGYLDELDWWG